MLKPSFLASQVINGVALGSIYALIALGYTLVYGVIRLINFAHGDIYMVGAFIGYFSLRLLIHTLYLPYRFPLVLILVVSIVASMIFCAIAGYAMEKLAYRPLRNATRIAALITAVGVSFFLENLGLIVFGANPQSYAPNTYVIYRVTASQSKDMSDAEAFDIANKNNLELPPLFGGKPFFVQISYRGNQGESVASPVLLVDPAKGSGAASFPEGAQSPSTLPPPSFLSYQMTGRAGRRSISLNWEEAGFDATQLPPLIPSNPVKLGVDVQFMPLQVIIVLTTIVMLGGLWLLIMRTKWGIAMRAISFDPTTTKLMGVNTDRVISLTFMLGSALAAVAGNLVGLYFTQIQPLMGIMPGLKAFIAAVVGGIGSVPGAALGGMVMGVSETLVKGYIPTRYSPLGDAVAFALLIIILLVKPTGILGVPYKEKV
jgi:branched-subunit amino acid ABC-type transport system permease component